RPDQPASRQRAHLPPRPPPRRRQRADGGGGAHGQGAAVKLYERLGDPGFHTTVVTTFGVDFDAFETIALSRLRGAGCRNVILVADSRMLGLALDGGAATPRSAGAKYIAVKAAPAGGGVFHPKVILQLGRARGRMIVASTN